MADVYEASDMRLGRSVAVKAFGSTLSAVSRPASSGDPVGALQHPNIVAFLMPALRVRLFCGDAAHRRNTGTRITHRLICEPPHGGRRDALAYVHSAGMVHRDASRQILCESSGHA